MQYSPSLPFCNAIPNGSSCSLPDPLKEGNGPADLHYRPMIMRMVLFIVLVLASIFAWAQPVLRPLSELQQTGVRISHLPGFHGQPITIKAEHPRALTLYYTTNGNFPDQQSPVFPSLLNADTVMVLSIRIGRNGKLSDSIYSGLYLVRFTSNLPIASLIIPEAFLFDPGIGMYRGGLTKSGTAFGNCWKGMEKPVYFEYFSKGNQAQIAQYCGLKIFGGMTKSYPEKSLRIIARKKYGSGKFKGKLFETKLVRSFNSLVLRMSGNDYMSTRFKDILISSLAKDINLDYMAYQPCVLFLNGKYWGIYNLREKISGDYIEENHRCNTDSLDLLWENAKPMKGSKEAYSALLHFLSTGSPDQADFIQRVEERMDVANFFNYQILQIYLVNHDYRGNIRYWRCPPTHPQFRWIYYDGDLGFHPGEVNFLEKRISETQTEWYNPEWSTFILRTLLKNQTLKNRFINQYCFLRSTWFSPDTMIARINAFHDGIAPEMPRHLYRRNFRQSMSSWEAHVEKLRQFSQQRVNTSLAELRSVFALQSPYVLTIMANTGSEQVDLFIHDNRVPGLPYSGHYFGEVPLFVRAASASPYMKFKSWSDGVTDSQRWISPGNTTSLKLTAMFEPREEIHSEEFGTLRIQTIYGGSSNARPWVEIGRSDAAPANFKGLLWNVETKKTYPVHVRDVHSLVLTDDTARWRSSHTRYGGQLIQTKGLAPLGTSLRFFLLDQAGAIVDSFVLNGSPAYTSASRVYVTREGDNIVLADQEPKLEAAVPVRTFFDRSFVIWGLILASSLTLFGLFLRRHLQQAGPGS